MIFTVLEVNHIIQQKELQDDQQNHLVDSSIDHKIEEWESEKDHTGVGETAQEENNDIELEEKKEIKMIFGGDVLLSEEHLSIYDQSNASITSIIETSLLEYIRTGDIFMVNQEFPFSNRGTKHKDKQYTFRVAPSRVNILNELGIDIVTLANNHTLDYGEEALLDTITTLEHGKIPFVGAGSNLDHAKQPYIYDHGEKKIAFLAASRVIPVPEWNATHSKPGLLTTYDPAILLDEIKQAKSKNDYVVVYVHWGIEREEYPKEYQRNLGRQYIDAGADIVIGSHPHVLQGIEFYNGKPIVYSLGNYIFNRRTYTTMLIEATINEENEFILSVIPCRSKNGQVSYEKKEGWEEFFKKIERLSYQVMISEDGVVTEQIP